MDKFKITGAFGTKLDHFVCTLFLLIGAIVFSTNVSAAQSVSLRLDWTTLGYHAPFYYGVSKGIYKDYGLTVNIKEGKGSAQVTQLIGADTNDFGFVDATTAALLIGRGLPVKVVMGILRATNVGIFYAKGRGINSAADLTGHKISSCPGDALNRYIPAYLRSRGVDPADVDELSVSCSLKYTVIAQHKADAIMSYGVAVKPLLANVGVTDVGYIAPGKSFYLPSFGIIASKNTITKRPDLVRRFVQATQQAWMQAIKHPDAAVAATISANPLLKNDASALKASFHAATQYINSPNTKDKPFGYQSLADWKKAFGILHKSADLGANVQPKEVFTNKFINSQPSE